MKKYVTFEEEEFERVKRQLKSTLKRVAEKSKQYLEDSEDVGTPGRTQVCRTLREIEDLQRFLDNQL